MYVIALLVGDSRELIMTVHYHFQRPDRPEPELRIWEA